MEEINNFGQDKKRYETSRINQELDEIYRYLLWNTIDELAEKQDVDYLQVFSFKSYKTDRGWLQEIVHSQECPPYEAKYSFPVSKEGVNDKVFVIDDGCVATMLFAEEY